MREQREPYRRRGDEMDLPEGQTCGGCRWFIKCSRLIGRIPNDERCDWSPSRFRAEPECESGIRQIPSGWSLTLHGAIKEFFIGENLFSRHEAVPKNQQATLVKTWASGNLGDGFVPLKGPLWLTLSFTIRPEDGVLPDRPPQHDFSPLVPIILRALQGYLYENEAQVQVLLVHKSWALPEQPEGLRVEAGKA